MMNMETKITKPETSGKVRETKVSPKAMQASKPDPEIIQARKAARAALSPEEQKKLDRALVEKAFSSREQELKRLISAGADIETVGDWHGLRLLSAVAREDIPKIAKLLIDSGADLEAKGIHGLTPLILAARYGRTEIAKMLIDAGADVHATAYEGKETALTQATAFKHTEIIELLKAAGAKE